MNSPLSRSLRILSSAMLTVAICIGMSVNSAAQAGTAAAALNGTVRDPSGAAVPSATITLINVQTGFRLVTQSNATGSYSLVNISPGNYTATVAKEGFSTGKSSEFELGVNQTATLNFDLRVGSTNTTVEVSANSVQIETSTAELGTVIGTVEVSSLPLNGRNFTELLLLQPGVSPVNTTENSGFGGGFFGNPTGTVVLPAINGQNNRSNMYLLDGINNYGSIRDTYAVQPTLDDIQEFKVQSHNDEAQFGQVLGGIVNVVTKSGTNRLHGDVWEFLRNDAMDAANYFHPVKTPLKQNQFGGGVGGPVILPHYNGHDKTFFYLSYEGFRNHTASNSFFRTPTAAQLGGDFSNLDSQGVQLYNPFSNNGTTVQPFMCDASGNPLPAPGNIQAAGTPCNKIPSSMISPTTVYIAKTLFPAPNPAIAVQSPPFNGIDTTPAIIRQDQISLRFDQQIGTKDRFFGRWTAAWEPITASGGYPGVTGTTKDSNYNVAVNWTHTFGSSSVLELTFGRTSAQANHGGSYANVPSNFYQQAGLAPNFYNHGVFGGPIVPGFVVGENYLGSTATFVGKLHYTNIWEYRGDYSKTFGRHSFRTGASLASYGWEQPFYGSQENFDQTQTQDAAFDSNTGDAMASMVLGVPSYAEVDNVYSLLHGGKIIGAYAQDQWRVNDKLTVNYGLRYDLTVNPRQGKSSNGSDITGDFNFSNGTYILQKPAPACSATQGAPCIPGGTLPPHVVIASNGKIPQDDYTNFQPRVGFAYRLTPRTVMHGGYARFYDNWAGITENISNFTQLWPNVAFVAAPGGFNSFGPPTGLANDPLNLGTGTGSIKPDVSPFTPLNASPYTDPHLKNGYSDQWNFGFQRELAPGAIATINYVGSRNGNVATTVTANAGCSGAPCPISQPIPYPYIQFQVPYTKSISSTNYNGLHVSSQYKLHSGIMGTIAYTWSKALTTGCDGYNSGCEVQNPYNLSMDRGPAAHDLTHIFTTSFVLPLPFGGGRRFSTGSSLMNHIIGNWQLNGILSLNSGPRYDVQDNNAISNISNFAGIERVNQVADPRRSTPDYALDKLHPINFNAFADPPTGSFGTMRRNSLTADWGRNLDLSLFRSFSISESKRFEFRAEAFNLTNTPVMGTPDTFLGDGNAYQGGTFGLVSYTANTERQLQIALKFYF